MPHFIEGLQAFDQFFKICVNSWKAHYSNAAASEEPAKNKNPFNLIYEGIYYV
jgi:hypothetical protein